MPVSSWRSRGESSNTIHRQADSLSGRKTALCLSFPQPSRVTRRTSLQVLLPDQRSQEEIPHAHALLLERRSSILCCTRQSGTVQAHHDGRVRPALRVLQSHPMVRFSVSNDTAPPILTFHVHSVLLVLGRLKAPAYLLRQDSYDAGHAAVDRVPRRPPQPGGANTVFRYLARYLCTSAGRPQLDRARPPLIVYCAQRLQTTHYPPWQPRLSV